MAAQPSHSSLPHVLGPGDPAYDRWWSELQHFYSIRQQLLNQPELRSKYVAIYRHAIIDTDADQFVLGARMAQRHPGEVVLIAKVELEDRRLELPSFEFQR